MRGGQTGSGRPIICQAAFTRYGEQTHLICFLLPVIFPLFFPSHFLFCSYTTVLQTSTPHFVPLGAAEALIPLRLSAWGFTWRGGLEPHRGRRGGCWSVFMCVCVLQRERSSCFHASPCGPTPFCTDYILIYLDDVITLCVCLCVCESVCVCVCKCAHWSLLCDITTSFRDSV